jgi:hypothetical protein
VDGIDLVDVSLEQLLCGEPHFWGICHVPTNVLQCFIGYLLLLLLARVTVLSNVSLLAEKPHKCDPYLLGLLADACTVECNSS